MLLIQAYQVIIFILFKWYTKKLGKHRQPVSMGQLVWLDYDYLIRELGNFIELKMYKHRYVCMHVHNYYIYVALGKPYDLIEGILKINSQSPVAV